MSQCQQQVGKENHALDPQEVQDLPRDHQDHVEFSDLTDKETQKREDYKWQKRGREKQALDRKKLFWREPRMFLEYYKRSMADAPFLL